MESFEKKNNCIKVDATKSIDEVYQELQGKLSAVHVYPPTPAEMMFVLGGPGSGKGTYLLLYQANVISLSKGTVLSISLQEICSGKRSKLAPSSARKSTQSSRTANSSPATSWSNSSRKKFRGTTTAAATSSTASPADRKIWTFGKKLWPSGSTSKQLSTTTAPKRS